MPGRLVEGVARALDRVLVTIQIPERQAAVRRFPARLMLADVPRAVLEGPAAFQQERLQAFLRKLLRRPAAADAGADHDGVEIAGFHAQALHCLPVSENRWSPS